MVFIPAGWASAQSADSLIGSYSQKQQLQQYLSPPFRYSTSSARFSQPDTTAGAGQEESQYPNPKSVLYKSLIIPGWGQVVNKQIWKVPIVYALIGGVTAYSIYLTKQYHDYRAAYYNDNHDDMKFGATPAYLQGINGRQLRDARDRLRNRRDLVYIGIGLAYGLNALDAYVYAHMRSFDVSEDLSMRAGVKPDVLAEASPGVTLSIEIFNRSKNNR